MSNVLYFKIMHTLNMKQKSIFAFVLGVMLVLMVSSTEMAFADYGVCNDDRHDDDKFSFNNR